MKITPECLSLQNRLLGAVSSGSCSCGGVLGGAERGVLERIREVLGVLHQLVGISDVCQAEPEDGPHPIDKAAITMFKVPGRQRGRSQLKFPLSCCINNKGPLLMRDR